MLEPEDDPRQYPSHIGIEDDNSFVEREGRHGRRCVITDTGKRDQFVVFARNLTAEVVANDRGSIT